jgi:hypothetical protein
VPPAEPAPAHCTTGSHESQTRSSLHLIPEEDPQHAVETDGDEEEEGDGGGIGEEDDDATADDEGEDEREPDENGDNGNDDESSASGSKTRRPLPRWLQEAFSAVVDDCNRRGSNGQPPLYARDHTFWFRWPSTYFLLQEDEISPSKLYNPQFFVWDPQALVKTIPCPRCQFGLQRHAVISRPRRCVDLCRTFWIVGYRYRCRHCIHPKTGKRGTVTWRSWDCRILAVLPAPLAAEFPAYLSHRTAISKALFEWMRSCFQNGMGPKQFSDAVRVQHLLCYDELHMQYLDTLVVRSGLAQWLGKKFQSFLPFDDTSQEGFHGYVPCSQLFRNVYNRNVEDHRLQYNQHTAMLPATICAIDHSHKVG